MKKIMMLMAALLLTACSKDSEVQAETPTATNGKTLVVYYSYTNNCHEIVTSLTSQIQADVMRIEPADKTQKYEANGYAIGTALLNAIKANPNDAASYPAIDPVSIIDLSQYQNIIIVTPLWWSQMAAIMQTYLFNYGAQMAGKHVALIVSSHSSGISGVVADARRLVPDCTWMGDALWINNSNHRNRASLIENWLSTLNFAGKQTTMDKMYITIDGGQTLTATLADNSSAQALMEALKLAPITYEAHDYGNFEKVGSLGQSFPENNESITTEPGDIILYQGSNLCLYYDTNTWNFTRIGKIEGKTQAELKQILKAGQGNISVTLSLTNSTTAIHQVRSTSEQDVYYSLNGQRVDNPTKGIYIRNGKKVIL
jgi:menaquinone-dependent protoporphyrinogen IX oxidase